MATIERVAGFDADVIHLVGGGSAIPLLRRLCASACERPVLAGPAEATVVGNAHRPSDRPRRVDDWPTSAVRRRGARCRRSRSCPSRRSTGRLAERDSRRRPAAELAAALAPMPVVDPAVVRSIDDARTTSSGSEQHLLVHVLVVGLALGQQQLGGRAAEQLAGLAHRAERHGRGTGELDVVVADDRQLDRARRRPCRVICCSSPSARRSLAQNAAVGRRAGAARRGARRLGGPRRR